MQGLPFFMRSKARRDKETINVRAVMGLAVKIVQATVTYRRTIGRVNLHNLGALSVGFDGIKGSRCDASLVEVREKYFAWDSFKYRTDPKCCD